MTKAELVEKLHKNGGKVMSKRALAKLLDEIFVNIFTSVKKDRRFVYPGFGTFTLRKRAARVGRNPRTGVEIRIGASRTVAFRPAPNIKSALR